MRLATTEKRVVCIETQRGCVFRCSFCFYNQDLSIRNRRFDLERVKRGDPLLARTRRPGAVPDGPGVPNLECRAGEGDLPFHCRTQSPADSGAHGGVGRVHRRRARLADARSAFLAIEVGLQTTGDNVLATVERRLRLQKFLDGIGYLKKYGLIFEVQLIYGLPGETRETFRKSLNFAAALDPSILSVFPLDGASGDRTVAEGRGTPPRVQRGAAVLRAVALLDGRGGYRVRRGR